MDQRLTPPSPAGQSPAETPAACPPGSVGEPGTEESEPALQAIDPAPSAANERELDAARRAANAAMDRYAAGDERAFAELYDLLAPRLHGFLVRHTHDGPRAEDLLQQTMLQIHAARGRFLKGADVTPWA